MATIVMTPTPGERLVRFVGDSLRFTVKGDPAANPTNGWQARLRTTLGRGNVVRDEVLRAHTAQVPPFGACWHDLPLAWNGESWYRDLLLAEVGYFPAKAYLVDPSGYQHWPPGPDFGVGIHPDWTRTANTLYCAFTRLFGSTRTSPRHLPESREELIRGLESDGYAVLPPSGTFRDLARRLPHIVRDLGFRILHLLPVHPTPTTFARFGRFGSPYAALDLTAVDPALVEFDRRANGVEQFGELTRAAHRLGARVFLDIVVNHTGWGSRLFEEHPEFFRREADGRFACPGAWGVTWEDLVELEQRDVALWDLIAEALLVWCRRGVDGFRCDAGYKIPTHVWQYITARVRTEFPDTVFLLEGLGGSWEATEQLLAEGGMQWAYSELFQNYSGREVHDYLRYALDRSARAGTYVHYSETHDNDRLAVRGRDWSLLRNRLCALASIRGGFGITCGVEWLAREKIRVHQRTGLAWDADPHLVDELARLNRLLADHPAFFDGAAIRIVSPPESPVLALLRRAPGTDDSALVLVNTRADQPASLALPIANLDVPGPWSHELLGQPLPRTVSTADTLTLELAAGASHCLSHRPAPPPGSGDRYRAERARIAWALQAASAVQPAERITLADADRDALAAAVEADPAGWLAALGAVAGETDAGGGGVLDLGRTVARWRARDAFPSTVVWNAAQARRITLVPPDWWLIVEHPAPFRAHLHLDGRSPDLHAVSIPVTGRHILCFPPHRASMATDAVLRLERFDDGAKPLEAGLRFLPPQPRASRAFDPEGTALLVNGRGGMSRLRIDFGGIRSKYDCALAANLHPELPVDRHVFVKRVRAWLNADGFLSALDRRNLMSFEPGPPARWRFRSNAGDGRSVGLRLEAMMIPERNTTLLRFVRDADDLPLPASLTLRVDLEDRSFHAETHRNPGAEHHFATHCQTLSDRIGFEFRPAANRRLRTFVDRGVYHPQPEWSEHVGHPIEASRGQVPDGDAFSPGWFEIPLTPGQQVALWLDADSFPLSSEDAASRLEAESRRAAALRGQTPPGSLADHDGMLGLAVDAFVARRGTGRTVIAGYPWFLDWGRDTLIAARGLLACRPHTEVLEILRTFGRFAHRGTLPNSIFGDDAANRDTSDAPLWYLTVLEELTRQTGRDVLAISTAPSGPTLLETARGIVEGYLAGTPNGIRVDPASALVWSPSHFTWMDTNHPAGTPREGYPVEIQALWIRALQWLAVEDRRHGDRWLELSRQAHASFRQLFWLPEHGWLADTLIAPDNLPAHRAIPDTALRCNLLLAVALGLATDDQARRCVDAAFTHLLVPGAMRSLAPLPVSPPLPIKGSDGRLLNDPTHPYWGRYEGDEDTRRKPAYHNGTAWTWFLPVFCEALAVAWNFRPEALDAARAILGSIDPLLGFGCAGQLPEIIDGDAPHAQRGCDAQAWSATEALRVSIRLAEWRIRTPSIFGSVKES